MRYPKDLQERYMPVLELVKSLRGLIGELEQAAKQHPDAEVKCDVKLRYWWGDGGVSQEIQYRRRR